MNPFIPRGYQCDSNELLWRYIHENPGKNPLVIAPTGTGKSAMIGMFVWRLLKTYPASRVMSVTHVKELIEGNSKTLKWMWPDAPVGVYSAGLKSRDRHFPITYAGIQSVHKKPAAFGKIDFVLIDEAHLVSDNDKATYNKFLDALRKRNPHLVVIGFTATGFRMSSGALVDGELFDDVAFDGGSGEAFVWFIKQGYLCKPIPKHPGFQLDSDAVSIAAGEFKNSEATAALEEQNVLERAVATICALGEEQNRRSWLTFAQSIEHAELIAEMFKGMGHAVEAVHSKRSDRNEVLEALKRGKLRGVVNRDILTTGFDHPPIDLIALLRLTRSPGLHVQMIGRGTRPVYAPGSYYGKLGHNGGPALYDLDTQEGRLESIAASQKQNCLVLDFVGNTERLGPINYPNLPRRRGKGGGTPPTRLCPQCGTYNHISIPNCEECGFEFPKAVKIKDKASSADLVSDGKQKAKKEKVFKVFPVHRMITAYHVSRTPGKPSTLRVNYMSGHSKFSTWVCLAHPKDTWPRRAAEKWWKQHGGPPPAPTDIAEAAKLAPELVKPKFIKVEMSKKYPEVVDYDFRGTRFEAPPEIGGPPLQEPGPDPTAAVREREEAKRAEQEQYEKKTLAGVNWQEDF